MKLKLNNAPAFKPVVLEITFETAEELKAMRLVGVYSGRVAQYLYDADSDADEDLIHQVLYNIWEELKEIK